jgi:outer membrane protein assembly factor BamB
MRLFVFYGSLALLLLGCDLAVDLGSSAKLDGGTAPAVSGGNSSDASNERADGAAPVVEAGSSPSQIANCSTTFGVQAGAPWPMAGRCPTRQARTTQIATQTAHVRWIYDAGTTSSDCPSCMVLGGPSIAADGTLYVAGRTKLIAVHPDGTTAWTASLDGRSAYGAPTIGVDGTIYLGASLVLTSGASTSGALYAFNPAGTKKWSYEAPILRAPSVASDGTLYAPGDDGNVYAIRSDGTLAWTHHTGGRVVASPTIGPTGSVYFGSSDGVLYAVDPDGVERWKFASGDPIRRAVVIAADGTIYGSNTKVFAVSSSGALLWTFAPPTGFPTGVAVAPDGTVRVIADGLFALTPAGTTTWGFVGGGGPSDGSPSIDGAGTSLFPTGQLGNSFGRFLAVDAGGNQKWTLTLPEGAAEPPAIGADGTVYFVVGTKLYALGA